MTERQMDRQLATARQAVADHLRTCEICDLAIRERPGATLCLQGRRLYDTSETFRREREGPGRAVRRTLSICDDGVAHEE